MKIFWKVRAKAMALIIMLSIIMTYLSPQVYALDESKDKAGVEAGLVESKESKSKKPEKEKKSPEESKENKKDSNKEENSNDKKENSDELEMSEEKNFEKIKSPNGSVKKNYTLTKKANSGNETKVGDYDTFYEVVNAMDINDSSSLYTVYVNRNVTILESEEFHGRSNNKIRLTSGAGGPYKLTRQGKKNYIAIQKNASLTIDNITLDGNKDGECLFISNNGVVTIGEGATIQNFIDTIEYDGPAIYMTGGTLNILPGATIQNNNGTDYGGVIYANDETATINIQGGEFKNNTSGMYGGVIANWGKLNIKEGTFDSNKALYGGAIASFKTAKTSIANAKFTNNKSKQGGAIISYNNINIEGSSFENNTATWGGAVFTKSTLKPDFRVIPKLTLNKSNFNNNTANSAGGALYLQGDSEIKESEFNGNETGEGEQQQEKRLGGGLYVGENAKVNISQNTKFTNNKAGMGGAIFTGKFDYNDPADTNKYQNLIIDNSSLFKGNEARVGLFLAPKNYKEFTNLKFDPKSDTDHGKNMPSSLLNNYDINYQSDSRLIIYDSNGGQFDPSTIKKEERHKLNDNITIIGAPTKQGYKFLYWKGSTYNPGDTYKVTENHTFTAQWNKIPELEVNDAVIEKGQSIDLRSLITKAADEEDGTDLKANVVIDQGGFDSNTAGVYHIKYKLTDKDGASVEKTATITVKEKKKPDNPPIIIPDYTPDNPSEDKPEDKPDNKPVEKPEDKPQEKPEVNTPPVLEVKDAKITVGDKIDLKSLIIKAYDKEDGDDLIDQVVIDQGDFNSQVPGVYKISYSLTNKKGITTRKTASVEVAAKPKKKKIVNPFVAPKTGVEATFGLYSSVLIIASGVYYKLRKQ